MTSLRSYQIQSELMLFEVKVALELSPEGLRSLIFLDDTRPSNGQ